MRRGILVLLSAVSVSTGTGALVQDEIFSDGFESGDTGAWSITFPPVCDAGEFNCYGNSIRECDVGPPARWVLTGTVCDPTFPNRCDPISGTCQPLQVTGGTTPTGTFFGFSHFATGSSPFLGGTGAGSFGDFIFVNRNGSHLDVYHVEVLDSDGDGEPEPNQHPSDPNNPGILEERVLTHVTTYEIPGLGQTFRTEVEPLADRVFFVAGDVSPSVVSEYVIATGVSSPYAVGSPTIDISSLGLGEVDRLFYGGQELPRVVYSLDPRIEDWVAEFEFPAMFGTHFDGLETVVDPNSGIQYVYVSDMASDFIGQYRRDPTLGWVQENLFEYDGFGSPVEGMGFGALHHLWITGYGNELYEVGGGDLIPFFE